MAESETVIEELMKRYYDRFRLLSLRFGNDYIEMAAQYSPEMLLAVTEHLEYIFNLMGDKEGEWYSQVNNAEMVMYRKYGREMQPYKNANFTVYFDLHSALVVKGIFTKEEFKAVKQHLNVSDFPVSDETLLCLKCHSMLSNALQAIYLNSDGTGTNEAAGKAMLEDAATDTEETDHPGGKMTRARQLLAIWYLLENYAIGHRTGVHVSSVARLAHLLSNVPLSRMQDSDIYKKYRQLPYKLKTGRELLNDLQYIRPFFVEVKLDGAVKMIDREIERLNRELDI